MIFQAVNQAEKTMGCRKVLRVGMLICAISGCARQENADWTPHQESGQISEALQKQLHDYLTKHCGTAADPKLLGDDGVSREHLLLGAALFNENCAQCHGVTGDGAGKAAEFLDPRPRDYRRGIFKFTSTPYGAKPLRADLIRTVRNGAKGTAMPSFALMPETDLQAVIDYVLVLTHRGELEEMLLREAQSEDEIDSNNVVTYIQLIVDRWRAATHEIVNPISPIVPYSDASVKMGEQAFSTDNAGCIKCHGPDGRGREIPNVASEPGSLPIRSADLTSGMLPGGNRPIDIYRRIYSGINGTPMPSLSLQFKETPEVFWHLVNYVEWLSCKRRRELEAEERHYEALNTKAER
jgi:mono/diheme cytochrome c family protein